MYSILVIGTLIYLVYFWFTFRWRVRRVLVDTTRNECAPMAECNSVLAVEIHVDPINP